MTPNFDAIPLERAVCAWCSRCVASVCFRIEGEVHPAATLVTGWGRTTLGRGKHRASGQRDAIHDRSVFGAQLTFDRPTSSSGSQHRQRVVHHTFQGHDSGCPQCSRSIRLSRSASSAFRTPRVVKLPLWGNKYIVTSNLVTPPKNFRVKKFCSDNFIFTTWRFQICNQNFLNLVENQVAALESSRAALKTNLHGSARKAVSRDCGKKRRNTYLSGSECSRLTWRREGVKTMSEIIKQYSCAYVGAHVILLCKMLMLGTVSAPR